jgi:Arc/MetJ family transcription regulator
MMHHVPQPGLTAPAVAGRGLNEGLGLCSAAMLVCVPDRSEVHKMRTNIEIDDKLMKDALKATGAKTKREAVELGLKTLVQLRAQEKARELRGKITWEGDLDAMRTDR